jgi:hypothetical protein
MGMKLDLALQGMNENRLMVFGCKREEVTGGWRKLHNEELHGVWFSVNIIYVIRSK